MTLFQRYCAVTGLVAALVVAALPAAGAPAPGFAAPPAEECSPVVPAALEARPGAPVDVDLLVLVDGVTASDAKSIVERAAISYRPAGVELLPRVRALSLSSDGTLTRAGSVRDTLDAARALTEAKARFEGVRPAGSDAVVMITSKDLFSTAGTARDYSLAGMADCVGGVRYATRSFAVIEAVESTATSVGGIDMDADRNSKLFAHELGHLFGAEHHFANCAEAQPATVFDTEPGHDGGLCTLMTNDIALMGTHFSTINAAVVRGHALRYTSD